MSEIISGNSAAIMLQLWLVSFSSSIQVSMHVTKVTDMMEGQESFK